MSDILSLLSKGFSFIGSLLLFICKIIKFIFTKFWKLILLICTGLLALFGIKQAINKEK